MGLVLHSASVGRRWSAEIQIKHFSGRKMVWVTFNGGPCRVGCIEQGGKPQRAAAVPQDNACLLYDTWKQKKKKMKGWHHSMASGH